MCAFIINDFHFDFTYMPFYLAEDARRRRIKPRAQSPSATGIHRTSRTRNNACGDQTSVDNFSMSSRSSRSSKHFPALEPLTVYTKDLSSLRRFLEQVENSLPAEGISKLPPFQQRPESKCKKLWTQTWRQGESFISVIYFRLSTNQQDNETASRRLLLTCCYRLFKQTIRVFSFYCWSWFIRVKL